MQRQRTLDPVAEPPDVAARFAPRRFPLSLVRHIEYLGRSRPRCHRKIGRKLVRDEQDPVSVEAFEATEESRSSRIGHGDGIDAHHVPARVEVRSRGNRMEGNW